MNLHHMLTIETMSNKYVRYSKDETYLKQILTRLIATSPSILVDVKCTY